MPAIDAGPRQYGRGGIRNVQFGRAVARPRRRSCPLRSLDRRRRVGTDLDLKDQLWRWLSRYRVFVNSRRTNGIIGDFDDTIAEAHNIPFANFTASADEAIAARVLKEKDPRLAAYSLKMAKADWQFAVAGMANPRCSTSDGLLRTNEFDQRREAA